jgi:peptidoglycan/LPS O-acetylase OafA/YrhL
VLNAYGAVDTPWARFAAPLPLMFLLPTIDRASIPFLEFFERLGRRSYGIYLSHFVILNAVVMVFTRSGQVPAAALLVPLFFGAALGLSLFLMGTLAKVTPARRVYRYLFGIVPPPLPQAR